MFTTAGSSLFAKAATDWGPWGGGGTAASAPAAVIVAASTDGNAAKIPCIRIAIPSLRQIDS